MLGKIPIPLYGNDVAFGFDPAASGSGFSDILLETILKRCTLVVNFVLVMAKKA